MRKENPSNQGMLEAKGTGPSVLHVAEWDLMLENVGLKQLRTRINQRRKFLQEIEIWEKRPGIR